MPSNRPLEVSVTDIPQIIQGRINISQKVRQASLVLGQSFSDQNDRAVAVAGDRLRQIPLNGLL